MVSVLVAGAGGVGLGFSFLLRQLPRESVKIGLLARSNYDSIKSNGINVINPWDSSLNTNFKVDNVYNSDSALNYRGDPYDFIIVTSKVLPNYAIPNLDKFMGLNSSLILAQNGIEIEEPYLIKYPNIPIISAVVRVGVGLTDLNELTFYTFKKMKFIIGLIDKWETNSKAIEKLNNFNDLCIKSGLDIKIENDIVKQRWIKTVSNGTFNNPAAILNLSIKEIIDSGSEQLFHDISKELWLVGLKKFGKNNWITENDALDGLSFYSSEKSKGFLPSTLQDVRKGKEIEYEALSGNIIRVADKLGVEVPVLKTVYYMLKSINYRIQKYGKL